MMINWTLLSLLLGAAAVAIAHSVLPDHWVPIAVLARTQRWSIWRVVRISALASVGHIVASLVLAGIIALAGLGLQSQHQLDAQQGHIVGIVLILTGLGFLIWSLLSRGHHGHSHAKGHTHLFGFSHEHGQTHEHADHQDDERHDHEHKNEHHEHHHDHDHKGDHHEHHHDDAEGKEQSLAKRLAAIVIPFGVAASPDLTILPVAFAASAVGMGAVISVLCVFSTLTLGTFVGLTVLATLVGYQIKGIWLEKHANTITSLILIALGIVAFIGL